MEAARSLTRLAALRKLNRPRALFVFLWILLGGGACAPPAVSPTPARATAPAPAQPSPTTTATRPPPTQTASPSPTTPPATLAPTPSATAHECWSEGGRIEQHVLYTDLSPWPWEFRVYLPPCYDQQPERRYPTLTLIHGSTYTDDQWDRLGVDETADALIAAGEARPFLIVMPRDRVWREPDEDPFGQAVMAHILPFVDAIYRTLPGREHRAIGGLSRGAAWAVHLGLSHWERFGAIGAHSLPVFWSDTSKIRGWLEAIPPDSLPRIYLDIGDRDYLIESATWFEGVLTDMDIPHEWHLFSGRHEEAYWTRHLEKYLRWYTEGWD